MTSMTSSGAPDPLFDAALLTVELELMRIPAVARLNGARRRAISFGILNALTSHGVLTGIPALEPHRQLNAA